MASVLQLAVVAVVAFLLIRSLHAGLKVFRRNLVAVSHIPGYRIYLHPHAILSPWMPRLGRYFNIGEQYTWRYKHNLFEQFKSDLISVVSYLPHTRSIITCDPEAIAFIVKERKKFVKPLGMYQPLAMFGPNVGVTEGTEWTRHRKIVASSNILENMTHLAWENTMRTLDLCFENWHETMAKTGQREVKVASASQLTLKLALFVILGAGFSHHPAWDDDSAAAVPAGYHLSFRHALHGILEGVWWKIVLPNFAYKLPFCHYFRHVKTSFDEFGTYLEDMVAERRKQGNMSDGQAKRQDLLGALVQASEDDDEATDDDKASAKGKSAKLTDREVIGNMYVFLLAGHDTAANTLAFTFGLLALYPDIQARLHASILEVLPLSTDELSFDKIEKLRYSLAVFMETLRMYPSVVVIPKYSMANTLVPVRAFSMDGGKTTAPGTKNVLIPQWAEVMLDVPGLHYNKRYWGEDAEIFRPERFLDDLEEDEFEQTSTSGGKKERYRWPREAFMGFSQGARSCLGQKFAQVEAVTIISEIIRRYEVHIDPIALKAGESTEQARLRLLNDCKTIITLTPKPLPIIFKERRS